MKMTDFHFGQVGVWGWMEVGGDGVLVERGEVM